MVRTVEGFEAGACDEGREDPYCGPVSRNEWFLWTFEVANITLFVILLSLFHPGRFMPRDTKVYLDPSDGTTERVGPGFGKADKRAFWVTIVGIESSWLLPPGFADSHVDRSIHSISTAFLLGRVW